MNDDRNASQRPLPTDLHLEVRGDVTPIHPPREGGYRGWVVVFVAFFNLFIFNGLFGSYSSKIEVYSQYFDAPRSSVVLVPSIMNGVCFLAGPITSALIKKFSFSRVNFLGGLIASCAILSTIFAKDILLVILLEGILSGFGLTLLYIPSFVSIGYYFEEKMPLAIAAAVSGSSLGPFAFAPLVNWLLDEYGWKGTNMILAAITFNSCWLSGFLNKVKMESRSGIGVSDTCNTTLKIPKIKCQKCQDAQNTCLICSNEKTYPDESSQTGSVFSSVAELFDLNLFKDKNFLLILLAEMGAIHIYYAFYVFLPLAAIKKGFTNYSAVLLVTLMAGSNAVGRAVLCLISYTLRVNNVALFSASLFLTGISHLLPVLGDTYSIYAATAVGSGFFSAALLSLTTIILKQYFGAEGVASSFGLINFCASVSVFTGATVLEWISETGDTNASFLYAASLQFICGILLFLLLVRDRKSSDQEIVNN